MVSRKKIAYEFNPYRRELMKALCLTKLSGADFRVLLFLLGQTDGYRRTQDKIRPVFFVERTGMDKGNIRRTISRLRKWHMITKHGQFYEVLPPDQWDKEVFVETPTRFNLEALLAEETTGFRFKSEAPTASNLKRQEVQIEAVLACSKENLSKENLSKENKKGAKAPDSLGAQTPASKYLFEKTGRKRWQNLIQKEQFEKAESEVGEARMKEAIEWALTSGISNIKSIITAARRSKHGESARQSPESIRRRETGTGGRRDKAPTHEEYIASLPPSQRPGKQ